MRNKMNDLTVIILTKNEEKNINDVIMNALNVTDDVLIIDSGSTDNTVSIAENNGARVVCRKWDNDFSAQRNFGLLNTDRNWVLYLDADERLTESLINSIKKINWENMSVQYIIKRKSVAFGKTFSYGPLRPDFVSRIFPKISVIWVNKVHERPECNLSKVVLEGNIDHYTYESWQQYWNKMNQYSSIWADNAYEQHKRSTVFIAITHAVFAFLQMCFLKRGFLDGWVGVALSYQYSMYVMMKYLKLKELE